MIDKTHTGLIVRDGLPFVIAPLAVAVIALLFGFQIFALLLFALAVFMAFFFRNPRRTQPTDANLVLSPADGRVTRIESLAPDNPTSPKLVSIFLSVFDVHINRAPIAGRISQVAYTKGKFVIATRQDASLINEQNSLTIEGERLTVTCKQIAGILARRIVCWKKQGDTVELGERFGLIKFSSRTDLILPAHVKIEVAVGDKVRGGATVIGRLIDDPNQG